MIRALRSYWTVLAGNKLAKNASIYVLGGFSYKFIGFLLIPIYTRVLTPADYGIYGITVAVGGLFLNLAPLGMRGALGIYYFEYRGDDRALRTYVTTVGLFLVCFVGGLVLVLTLWGQPLWSLVTSGSVAFSPYVQLVLWSTFFVLLIEVSTILYQVQQKARQFITVQQIRFVLTLASTILLVVVWRFGVLGQLLGTLIGNGLILIALTVLWLREWFIPRFHGPYLRESLAFGLPLVPHAVAAWALAAADRLILERFVSIEKVGLYTLAYSLGMVMSLLVNSINKAWAPYYYDAMAANRQPDRRVRQTLALYMTFIGGLCLGGAVFTQEIIFLLTPARYHATAPYVPLLLFAFVWQGYYFFAVAPLFYFKRTRYLPLITMLSAILNIALNIWLIPRIGLMGAVWATVATYACLFAITYSASRRLHAIGLPFARYAVVNVLILGGVLAATYLLPDAISPALFLLKLIYLGIFGLAALGLLIRPYGLQLQRSPTAVSSQTQL